MELLDPPVVGEISYVYGQCSEESGDEPTGPGDPRRPEGRRQGRSPDPTLSAPLCGAGGFYADARWFHKEVEAEERPLIAAGPSQHPPPGLDIAGFAPGQNQLIRSTIRLRREADDGCRRPDEPIFRSVDIETNAFLLDVMSNAKRQHKVPGGVFTRIEYGALARFAYGGFFYEEHRQHGVAPFGRKF